MAFSKGTESVVTEGGNFTLYTGVAPVNVIAVNPTAEQLSAIYGRKVEKIPEYTGKTNEDIDYIKLDFIVKISEPFVEKNLGIAKDVFGKISFLLSDVIMRNKDNTKFKVINNYGRTQWITPEIAEENGYPLTNDGREMTEFLLPYKPCVRGEEELVEFLRCFLNIEGLVKNVDGALVVKTGEELVNCECYFTQEDINALLKGNINIIKDLIQAVPINQVYCLFTVKGTEDNKKYQNIFNKFFAKAKDWNHKDRFEKFIANNQGSIQGYEYSIKFQEFEEKPNETIPPFPDTSSDCPW
jgi:hypothetical protein